MVIQTGGFQFQAYTVVFALQAPILTWTSGTGTAQPVFDLALDDAVEGDTVQYEVADEATFTPADDSADDTLDAGEVAAEQLTPSLDALTSGTWYVRVRHKHAGGSYSDWSNTVSKTIDVTAPVLSSPTGTKTGTSTADLSCSTDTGAGIMYVIVQASAAGAPSAAQVVAGQNSSSVAAVFADNDTIGTTGAHAFAGATGLTPNTGYKAYFVHEDAASPANPSSVSATSTFTTDASTDVLVDAASSHTTGGSFATSLSWTHTPVGTPTGVMVMVVTYNAAVSGVTYNGVAMGEGDSGYDATNDQYISMFGLADPDAGAQTVVVSCGNSFIRAKAVSVTNSDLSTMFRAAPTAVTNFASGTAAGITVNSAAGDLVVDAIHVSGQTATPHASQTENGSIVVSNSIGIQSSRETGAGATVSMDWTKTSGVAGAMRGVSVKKA